MTRTRPRCSKGREAAAAGQAGTLELMLCTRAAAGSHRAAAASRAQVRGQRAARQRAAAAAAAAAGGGGPARPAAATHPAARPEGDKGGRHGCNVGCAGHQLQVGVAEVAPAVFGKALRLRVCQASRQVSLRACGIGWQGAPTRRRAARSGGGGTGFAAAAEHAAAPTTCCSRRRGSQGRSTNETASFRSRRLLVAAKQGEKQERLRPWARVEAALPTRASALLQARMPDCGWPTCHPEVPPCGKRVAAGPVSGYGQRCPAAKWHTLADPRPALSGRQAGGQGGAHRRPIRRSCL